MKESLKYTLSILLILLIAVMLSASFMAIQVFFNDIVTSKQYGLEIITLFAGGLFLIALFFHIEVKFTKTDLLVMLFAAWYVINELYNGNNYTPIDLMFFNIFLWGLVYMFVRQSSENHLFVWGVAVVWMVVVLLQSGLGLMQLYGLERSNHGLFSITGSFHNPGPFSGYVVSALPMALGIILYTNVHGDRTEGQRCIYLKWFNFAISYNTIAKYLILALAWSALVAILLVLPPALSRAAWIAGVAGCLFVVARFTAVGQYINQLKNKLLLNKSLRIILVMVISATLIGGVFGLYTMKKGSADGRALIWQVTAQIIKQKPITGHGTGAFSALYMNEQANWFASDRGTQSQAMVAGSPEAPFNELLKLWLEKGLIAMLLAGAILYIIFFKRETPNPQLSTSNPQLSTIIKGALISLLTFSLFSYPFDISSFTLQLVVLVAILAAESNAVISIKGKKTYFITIPAAILLVLATIYYVPQRQAYYQAMKTWGEADRFYSMRSYNIAVEAYAEAFPTLKTNGLYLQMYGKALSMNEQHQESNEILTLAQQRFSSHIIQNTLGDNHKALSNYNEAEAAYTKSAQMNPTMLLPKYLLAKLYNESGQHHKAKQTAEEILNSPVKVESSATREIMNEMKSIVAQLKDST